MSKLTASQKETLALFKSGAEKLERAINGLSEKELDYCLAPGEWTIRQIVHHVAEDGDAWSMTIKRALATPGVLVNPYGFPSNEVWANALAFDKRPISVALSLFKAHRQVMAELAAYFPDKWEQNVTYPSSKGKEIKSISVGQIIRMLGEHLEEHLATIDAIKRKYSINTKTMPTTKAELLEDIREQRKHLENALKGLTEADMVKSTAPGVWSAKDILAHITVWEKSFLTWYETGLRGEKQVIPDWKKPGIIDGINWGIYERNLKRGLTEVLTEFRDSYKHVLDMVEAAPEEVLFTPGKYDWTGKTTLADYIVSNTSNHYAEHIPAIEAIKRQCNL